MTETVGADFGVIETSFKREREGKLKAVTTGIPKGDQTVREKVVYWANRSPNRPAFAITIHIRDEKQPCGEVCYHPPIRLPEWFYDSQDAEGMDLWWRGLE